MYQYNHKEFIVALEDQSLPDELFTHEGHLRAAWIYLCDNEPQQAAKKCCTAIKDYAESLGATDKFNLTISMALMEIVAVRLSRSNSLFGQGGDSNWRSFKQQNSDLFDNALAILFKYYDKEVLFSEKARHEFLPPKVAFDC